MILGTQFLVEQEELHDAGGPGTHLTINQSLLKQTDLLNKYCRYPLGTLQLPQSV